jgi:hypothetical protein
VRTSDADHDAQGQQECPIDSPRSANVILQGLQALLHGFHRVSPGKNQFLARDGVAYRLDSLAYRGVTLCQRPVTKA